MGLPSSLTPMNDVLNDTGGNDVQAQLDDELLVGS
jgi:hypothetical protein